MELIDELQKLRETTPSLDYMMKVFEEADRVNTEAQIAMGQLPFDKSSPVASTNAFFTFSSDVSTGEQSTLLNQ